MKLVPAQRCPESSSREPGNLCRELPRVTPMATAVKRRVIFLALIGVQTVALAQSINIDLGHPGTAPPIGYRAAGMPGAWNKFEAVNPQTYALFDLGGQPTGATVNQIGGTEILDATLSGPGRPTGPDAVLLKDALITHTGTENCLFFHGLAPGSYEVLTYAWMPGQVFTRSNVHIDTNPSSYLIGGLWTGAHAEMVTYARHVVQVTANGFLGPHSGVPSGGNYAIGAAINGIQLRLMGVEPPLFVSRPRLTWLTSLNAVSYDVVRGDLRLLHDSGGNFTIATQQCLANNSTSTVLDFAGTRPAGEGDWFLVRGVSTSGSMTYNSPGSSQVGSRDAEIAAAAGACQ